MIDDAREANVMNEHGEGLGRRDQALRDVVERALDQHWSQWAQAHPHLAAAIDRMRLADVVVQRLREDPAFVEAMEAAALDEARLAAAARVLERVRALVERLVG